MSFSSIFVDGSLQWQSSTDNVNFFDVIGQTGSTYTTGLISADTYIRLKAFCADSAYSNVKYVKVNNPQILSTINDTVCGQGNVSLQATANPGYFIRWYADSTSGNYLTNGSPYNTFVTQTDTFWVAALVDTLVGSGGDTLTTTFAGGNGANGNFFDVNVTSPVTLTGMRINNNTAGAVCEVWYRSGTHVGFEGSSAGWTQIYNGPVAAAQGYVTGLNLPLSNGVTSFFVFLPAGGITYTNGVNLGGVVASDANLPILEGYGTGGTFGSGLFGPPTSTRIWNGSLIYSVPNCVSARVPVIAVVNPAPSVTVSPTASTICENSSVTINVTGGLLDYTNFDWAPATGLDVTSGPALLLLHL
ncbi:MAG: hypothetical protein IPM91_05680 [Bacteroidetes bacterium]|nr:hypothetical protein [Bacteroidota bacterium]